MLYSVLIPFLFMYKLEMLDKTPPIDRDAILLYMLALIYVFFILLLLLLILLYCNCYAKHSCSCFVVVVVASVSVCLFIYLFILYSLQSRPLAPLHITIISRFVYILYITYFHVPVCVCVSLYLKRLLKWGTVI